MGYTTDFSGSFEISPALKPEHMAYLNKFAQTRRMKRNASKTALRPDPVRTAAKLPVGPEGAYFVNEEGFAGQTNGKDVVDGNGPPVGQPGLWCQWVPTDDGEHLVWDESEKFYHYTEWIEYLIEHFLKPWGYKVNGAVKWQGEEHDDAGTIFVKDNSVEAINE